MDIQEFAELVEKEQNERLKKEGREEIFKRLITRVIPGKKYTKVDVGTAGKFMLDKEGRIFGIKRYGQVHKGRCYGTLDTIDQWNWGYYVPTKKA